MPIDAMVTGDDHGALIATVTGKAPLTLLNGKPLTSIDRLEVLSDGFLISTLENIAPGEAFSVVDNEVPWEGDIHYQIVTYNSAGASPELNLTCKIGLDRPTSVTDLQMTEDEPGKVTLSWTPPVFDINGRYMENGYKWYTIGSAPDVKLDPDNYLNTFIEETTFTLEDLVSVGQTFFQPAVTVSNNQGRAPYTFGNIRAIGFPYALPYTESFQEGPANSILLAEDMLGTIDWNAMQDGALGINSVDNDNGFIVGEFSGLQATGLLETAKIDLRKAENPVFSFYTYDVVSEVNGRTFYDINDLAVLVRDHNSDDWEILAAGTVHELCNGTPGQWNPIQVSLEQYKGKQVQLALLSSANYYKYVMFDNLRVQDLVACNVSMMNLTAPSETVPNKEFPLTAKIANNGTATISDYTVNFYRNDVPEPFRTVQGESLRPGEYATFTAMATIGLVDNDATATYHAVVNLEGDENTLDNTSANVTVQRVYSEKTAPTELTAQKDEGGVVLSWVAPELPEVPVEVNEDCENLPSWSYENIGDWTLVDADLGEIGGASNVTFPKNPLRSKRSFFVFDKNDGTFNDSWNVHSGSKCLIALFNYDDTLVDDWAISPELDSNEQTISFWARSYNANFAESIQVLRSENGCELSDFSLVKSLYDLPGTWTKYSFTLPAGTKHFAIRNYTAGKFALMLDDITYTPAPDVIAGYNIYLDGMKLNDAPIQETTYRHTSMERSQRIYRVTAVYTNGEESAPVAAMVTDDPTEIDSILSEAGSNIDVFSDSGIVIMRGVSKEDLQNLTPGTYVIKTPARTFVIRK